MERTLDRTTRLEEVRHLASAIFAESFGMDFETALDEAQRQVDTMLEYAADWDAAAEREAAGAPPVEPEAMWHEDEPVYVPSALEPHEQRAVDKAIFERACGIVPQLVGRFWFVPSRTQGGIVYRVTLDSCTCEAYAHGRLCWHRALIGIERELAA
jgi:hypothetical protein